MRCDNHATCRSEVPEQATEGATQMLAVAKGWHLWSGETLSGKQATVVLCKACVGANRRPERPKPDHLPQETLFP